MTLTITCPICGKRNGYEFRFGGEEKGPRPAEKDLTPEQWCEYAYMNKCVAGVQKEWWFHKDGCACWFTIYRDTTSNLEVANPGEGDRRNSHEQTGKSTHAPYRPITTPLREV